MPSLGYKTKVVEILVHIFKSFQATATTHHAECLSSAVSSPLISWSFLHCCAMAQVVSHWPVTTEAWYQSQACLHVIFVGQIGTETGFPLSILIFVCQYLSINAPHSYFIHLRQRACNLSNWQHHSTKHFCLCHSCISYEFMLQAGQFGVWIPVGMRFSVPIQNSPEAHPASFTIVNVTLA
jgi:hypothetical protein